MACDGWKERFAPGRRRPLLVTATLLFAAIAVAAGLGARWRGRAERHLVGARRALASGDPAAVSGWLAAPEADPSTRDRAFVLRARAALARGRPAEAAAPLERVDPRGPHAAEAAFWKGRTLLAAHQPRLALAWFRRCLADRPDDVEARRWLAAAAYDLGDRATALDALAAVTRQEPRDARAWRTLGLIRKEKGEHAHARSAYEQALEADPKQPSARLELAECLVTLGDLGAARQQLDACKGGVPEPDRAELLARCLLDQGDPSGARAVIVAALAAAPDHAGLLGQRAGLAQAEGHPAEALDLLDRALQADPHNPRWHYRRGLVLGALGRPGESRLALARAEALNKALTVLAELDDEAALRPDDPDVRCRLGRQCLLVGKPQLAASWYRAALACDPYHPAARLGLRALEGR